MLKQFIERSLIGLGIAYLITTFWVFVTPAQEASATILAIWGIASIIYILSVLLYSFISILHPFSIFPPFLGLYKISKV